MNHVAVEPIAGYIGGKRFLSARIIDRLAEIEHDAYVEPFVGMGGVFLRRPRRAHAEVINDISRDVANLFRVLQRHYEAFMDLLKWQLTSRGDFERLMAAEAGTLTDLERAARFLYLQRMAFGGKVAGRSFGITPGAPGRFDVGKLAIVLEAVRERLAGVTIECLPWADLIARYDRPGMLFYLDPPYWGCETDYGAGVFSRSDFRRMANVLAGLQGTFLLSINDVPEIRKTFAAFKMEEVALPYTIGTQRDGRPPARELLVTPQNLPFRRQTDLLAL